jgi:hypothetical protein
VPGETIEDLLERGPLNVAEPLTLFRQVSAALEYAHDAGSFIATSSPQASR